jgi:DNA invertase Pin-like site-specific DNA recombinase
MTTNNPTRAALYARVSTADQTTENQLLELRRYAEARGWAPAEYVDEAVSGSRERRPALDAVLLDAKRRRFDVLVVWRLDRLGRSLKHLIMTLDELTALGVAFSSLNEGIDTGTPAGRLQLHLLGAIAEFERARIVERVRAGIARAKSQGRRLGRRPTRITDDQLASVEHLSERKAAATLDIPRSVLQRARVARNPSESAPTFAPVSTEVSESREVAR